MNCNAQALLTGIYELLDLDPEDPNRSELLTAVAELRDGVRELLGKKMQDKDTATVALERVLDKRDLDQETVSDLFPGVRGYKDEERFDVVEDILIDVCEILRLLTPILGGYSDQDDMDTVTMRACVDRVSRKLL